MTDDTVTSVDNGDSLEAFEADFYGTTKPVEEKPVEEAEETADLGEDDLPAPEEEDEAEEAEPEDSEDSDEEDEEEEEKPRKNKVPFNKRIEQLNAKLREQERREADKDRRLAALEAAINEKAKEEQTPLREQLPQNAPNPDAKDDKGEPLYPLGEFDPQYIADLTQHTIDERMKVAEEKRQREEYERAFQQQREELSNQWIDRLDKAEEEIPEIRENIRELTDTFQNLDPGYGEYLAATLMSMDNGHLIMNYLSQNIGEAQKIVNLGPALATVAFGRLDAILAPKKAEPEKKKKTSKAPPPPEDRSRGSSGKFAVRPDTDNLDAFEKAFFS